MSDEQLGLTLKEAADSYFRLRTQGQTERLDAPSELRKSRRLIARVKTIQREREVSGRGKVCRCGFSFQHSGNERVKRCQRE